MNTSTLVTVELPNGHIVVRLAGGRRVGTIFKDAHGWRYQFDGTPQEGPRCEDPREALGIMQAVAKHQHLFEPEPQPETD